MKKVLQKPQKEVVVRLGQPTFNTANAQLKKENGQMRDVQRKNGQAAEYIENQFFAANKKQTREAGDGGEHQAEVMIIGAKGCGKDK